MGVLIPTKTTRVMRVRCHWCVTGYTLVHEDRYGDPDKPDTVQVRDFRTPRTCVVCGGVFRLALESTIVARPLEAGEPHARRRARRG